MEFEVTMADIAKTKSAKTVPSAPLLCRKCQQNPATLTIRTEPACKDCYITYAKTKFTKHMEPFRVKKSIDTTQRKLLVAVSLGTCSLALLDMLHWHRSLQIQRARRAAYDVTVVYIDDSSLNGATTSSEATIDSLNSRYSQFKCQSLHLETIYDYSESAPEKDVAQTTANGNSEPTNIVDEISVPVQSSSSTSSSLDKLSSLMKSLPSRSSQIDMISILRTKLLISFAKHTNHEAILMGDTQTRLAQMVMAEVTKGRGHAVPWLISDGPTPYDIPIYRPLRDLSRAEVATYLELCDLSDLVNKSISGVKPVTSSKQQTIDDIMGHYFDDITNAHLVANVVKTAAKLQVPNKEQRVIELGTCEICGLPMDKIRSNPKGSKEIQTEDHEAKTSNNTEQNNTHDVQTDAERDARIWSMYAVDNALGDAEQKEDLRDRRCYGCRRTTLGVEQLSWPGHRI